MLAIWILCSGFSFMVSGAMINDLVQSGQQAMVPQNLVLPFLNYNMGNKGTLNDPINDLIAAGQQAWVPQNVVPLSPNHKIGNIVTPNNPINGLAVAGQPAMPQNLVHPFLNNNIGNRGTSKNPPLQATDTPKNLENCPNAAILFNILNILTNSLPKDGKSMSEPEKFKLSGVTYTPGNNLKNPHGMQYPLLYANPESIQVPSFKPPMEVINGKNPNLQPNINYINTIGLKGLPGIAYENQQNVKFLTQKFYEGNNLAVSNSINPSVKKSLYFANGNTVPFNTGVPNADPYEMINSNPNIIKNPNLLIDPTKQNFNQQKNLLDTNIKIIQTEMASPINKVPNSVENNGISNMQNLQDLHNLKIQSSLQQNVPYTNPNFPQQSFDLNQYRPALQVNNQFHGQGLGFNQISPFVSYDANYNNGQSMITDNTNYGGMFDLNSLLGVTNLSKLNAIPHKNGVVELTYMLKKPKPVYESQYYVKYRLPYQTFLYNLQNILAKKPNLRNEPSNPNQDLLVGSNVTDASKDLKGLNYEDILELTATNGTLVTAKILESNDTEADKTLKLVQELNSKLPVEKIISLNVNATRNLRLETQKNINGSENNSKAGNNLLNNVNHISPDVQRRGVYPQYPFNTFVQNPSRLQINPYTVYQNKPVGYLGMPLLKYGTGLRANIMNNPILNPTYIANRQFGR
ncbi:probable serine/threonine-protein kinase clkA isoform X3 [Pararge aegeria]|uniref:probable serine/threonine-protein kinase clkA isoform X3 n=1 Tax=Pararge aegeria TaxID=116150 RepID=UPI0019D26ED9|nr:probable serine/threonine-protein kinase clkA isoform X3 [Pararge aegeria]